MEKILIHNEWVLQIGALVRAEPDVSVPAGAISKEETDEQAALLARFGITVK